MEDSPGVNTPVPQCRTKDVGCRKWTNVKLKASMANIASCSSVLVSFPFCDQTSKISFRRNDSQFPQIQCVFNWLQGRNIMFESCDRAKLMAARKSIRKTAPERKGQGWI